MTRMNTEQDQQLAMALPIIVAAAAKSPGEFCMSALIRVIRGKACQGFPRAVLI
jgi:hypothetical protein